MSKLMYMLTVFMMTFSLNAYAEEECPEGQVFDPDTGVCIEAPEEIPES